MKREFSMSQCMRFPTMWYVRPAKPQISLLISTVWSEPLLKSLEYSIIVKLLTERHFEFLSLKGGCRGSPESTLVKNSHCWKSHAVAVDALKFWRLIACQICLDKQTRPRSDCFFPVHYSDKHFVNSSPDRENVWNSKTYTVHHYLYMGHAVHICIYFIFALWFFATFISHNAKSIHF